MSKRPPRKKWYARLLASYKQTWPVERMLHATLAMAIVADIIRGPLGDPDYGSHVLYWAQVISGNWPGAVDALVKYKGELLLSLLAAVIINLATLGALAAGFLKLTRMERHMDTRDMVVWHGILLKQQLEKNFTALVGDETKVKDAVAKSFDLAKDELKDYAGMIERGEAAQNKFREQIEQFKF